MILAFITFIIYVTYIYIRWQPGSISESYYKLGGFRGRGWIFTLWTVIVGFSVMPDGLFMMLSGGALVLVGVASPYKMDDVKWYHAAGALICIISGMAHVLFKYGIWESQVIFITLIPFINRMKNKIYWLEVGAFLSIFIPIIYEIL